jgi:hypothetical protein
MSDELRRTHAIIAGTLDELSTLFHKHCKLTFVMRDPLNEEGFIVVSEDASDAVIEVLQKASAKEEDRLTRADCVAAKLGLEMPR